MQCTIQSWASEVLCEAPLKFLSVSFLNPLELGGPSSKRTFYLRINYFVFIFVFWLKSTRILNLHILRKKTQNLKSKSIIISKTCAPVSRSFTE